MTTPQEAQSARSQVWLAMLGAAVIAAFAFWPALRAGITPEDFGWMVAARQLDSPWPFIAGNPFFVYFYRPLPLVLWWLSGQAFADHAIAHNALDLVLNALNAALLARLAWRISGRVSAAWITGLAFACLPCAAGTALWMSDRFDPVALTFGLGALLAFERALLARRAAIDLGLLLFGALLSKETAYAIAGWLLLRLAVRAWRRHERRFDLWLALLAPVALALASRRWAGTALDSSVPTTDVATALTQGVLAWWQRLPHALYGFAMDEVGQIMPLLAALAAATLAGLMLPAARALTSSKARATSTLFMTGATLLATAPLLQWPITRYALLPAGYAVTMNLRFYYLAAAGIALLVGAGVSVTRGPLRHAAVTLLALLCIGGLVRTRTVAAAWTAQFAGNSARHLTLSRELAARDWPMACRIVLDAPDFDDDFRVHADIIAKAAAKRGAALRHCTVFAGTKVFIHVTDAALCRDDAWPGLEVAQSNGVAQIAPLGNLCTLQFVAPPAADDARALRLRVDADGHVHET